MNPFMLNTISIVAYLTSSICIAKDLSSKKTAAPKINPLLFAWIAACIHGYITYHALLTPDGVNLGFFSSTSLVSVIVVLLFLLAAISKPIEKLGIAIFPIAALMLCLEEIVPARSHILTNTTWQMDVHVLTSIVAFSLLNIAAFQAILLAIQDHQLHRHAPNRLFRSLPPLQTMETLLFQMIGAGLIFLSISLISGFFFIEDLFAQHLVHKTVLSIIAWVVFFVLLMGRIRYG
ncbi:MAG: cytochrome C assembly family protein, partial [Gammaproteobacteria bacterium]